MMLRKDEIEEKNRYIGYQKTVHLTLQLNRSGTRFSIPTETAKQVLYKN